MAAGFKSYTAGGVTAIDSDFRSYALVGEEVYTGAAKHTGWLIPCAEDEILVLSEANIPIHVYGYRNKHLIVCCLFNRDNAGKPIWTPPVIKICRFSYKPPVKKGLFNVYTESGDLAFTSGQLMLRPFRQITYNDGRWDMGRDTVWGKVQFPNTRRLGILLTPTGWYEDSSDVGSIFHPRPDDYVEVFVWYGYKLHGNTIEFDTSDEMQSGSWSVGGYPVYSHKVDSLYGTNNLMLVYL